MEGPVKAYVGLGSNLGDREATLRRALEQLENQPRIDSVRAASFIETRALGPVEQPDYLNTTAELITTALPYQLLEQLQEIEIQFGRERKEKWGPRTLDLDLLIYNHCVLDEPLIGARLTVDGGLAHFTLPGLFPPIPHSRRALTVSSAQGSSCVPHPQPRAST